MNQSCANQAETSGLCAIVSNFTSWNLNAANRTPRRTLFADRTRPEPRFVEEPSARLARKSSICSAPSRACPASRIRMHRTQSRRAIRTDAPSVSPVPCLRTMAEVSPDCNLPAPAEVRYPVEQGLQRLPKHKPGAYALCPRGQLESKANLASRPVKPLQSLPS